MLEFGIKDINVDLFKQVKGNGEIVRKEFLRKLIDKERRKGTDEYVRLVV